MKWSFSPLPGESQYSYRLEFIGSQVAISGEVVDLETFLRDSPVLSRAQAQSPGTFVIDSDEIDGGVEPFLVGMCMEPVYFKYLQYLARDSSIIERDLTYKGMINSIVPTSVSDERVEQWLLPLRKKIVQIQVSSLSAGEEQLAEARRALMDHVRDVLRSAWLSGTQMETFISSVGPLSNPRAGASMLAQLREMLVSQRSFCESKWNVYELLLPCLLLARTLRASALVQLCAGAVSKYYHQLGEAAQAAGSNIPTFLAAPRFAALLAGPEVGVRPTREATAADLRQVREEFQSLTLLPAHTNWWRTGVRCESLTLLPSPSAHTH